MIIEDNEKFWEFEKAYWQYYLELEKQMISTRVFVDFSINNFGTYSLEYLKLYQAVCSEIDVFGKVLANTINPEFDNNSRNNNIQKWWYEVQDWFDNIEQKTVYFCEEYYLAPWKDYKVEAYVDRNGANRYRLLQNGNYRTPAWWTSYNYVKHHRTSKDKKGITNFQKANLENVSKAFAALYILEKNCLLNLGNYVERQKIPRSYLFEGVDPLFLINEQGHFLITYDKRMAIPND